MEQSGANPVVITGMGAITALGNNPETIFDQILLGKSAARHWPDLEAMEFKNTFACRIEALDVDPLQRGKAMLLQSLSQALTQAKISDTKKTGVFLGSTMGESVAFEQVAEGAQLDLHQYNGYSFVRAAKAQLRSSGTGICFGNACAAGNYAIGSAVRAIQSGRCENAIAGGVDPFSKIAMIGFSRSRAMAPTACKPFDNQREGMLLGEGCAVLFLERLSAAKERGVLPVASVLSLGLSSDAYHPTAPRPDGAGIRQSIESALKPSGLSAKDIDWVCAHGSGTKASDLAEGNALAASFGPFRVPVSAYKGAFGHTLGAASAIEAMLTAMGLSKGVIPQTVGYNEKDNNIELDIIKDNRELPQLKKALNCGYAFGGHNSSLLMEKT